ncbi:hypothetical protein Tco_1341855, partial [Tanacetum coccineum]
GIVKLHVKSLRDPHIKEKGDEFGLDSNDDDVVPRVEDVPLVDGVLDGAFDGQGDEDFAMGEGLDEEAWVDAIDDLKD